MLRTSVCLLLAGVLLTPAHARQPAYLSWTALEQYQAQSHSLTFTPSQEPQGYLLIWPEVDQAHRWLGVAHYWQQQQWQVSLLLPEDKQSQFDASDEHASAAQQAWQSQQLLRLNAAAPETSAGAEQAYQVALLQGSAALWYQQGVDAGDIALPQALVLFDALPSTRAQQSMLAISLARSPYPILDIYSQPESPLAWHNQQQRHQQLQRREKTGYAQMFIKEPTRLNKSLSGWLVRLGWLPLPRHAPLYLQEQHSESGISRPRHATSAGPTAPP
ncbi:DUF3530 family protein [Oceanisphaera avium]|uniref:DUF3530 family protein n=1 Tax=Oceanisphaera avium TaxID=1903694 RepID=UPI0012FAC1EA|nr:DUF3530 family protein [Oceanisphaera avium]